MSQQDSKNTAKFNTNINTRMIELIRGWLKANDKKLVELSKIINISKSQITKTFAESRRHVVRPDTLLHYIHKAGGSIDVSIITTHNLKGQLYQAYKSEQQMRDWIERIVRQVMGSGVIDYRGVLEDFRKNNPNGFYITNFYDLQNFLPITLMRYASVLGIRVELIFRMNGVEPMSFIIDERDGQDYDLSKFTTHKETIESYRMPREKLKITASTTPLGESLRQFL